LGLVENQALAGSTVQGSRPSTGWRLKLLSQIIAHQHVTQNSAS